MSDLLQIQNRFLRSANLERDFADPKALSGYVLTPQVKAHLQLLANGMNANSGRRAWRITGDFGTGKSSFALVVAHLFSERNVKLPALIRQAVNFKQLGAPRPRLLPVLITGSREPLATALLRALNRVLGSSLGRGRPPAVCRKIEAALDNPETTLADSEALSLISEANDYVVASGKATGLLIILDELGKFLEYAAFHPDQQDIFILQQLAEMAARSQRAPMFVIGLLHQGFSAYADHLSQLVQREWEKVAGRFDELLFNQALEETAGLVGDALNIRSATLPTHVVKQARTDMRLTLDLGWYGPRAVKQELVSRAERLYPLHPTVLPILVQLFSRFGQHQRSLFSFLLSNEPFALVDFVHSNKKLGLFYRLCDLYDYARATFGHYLSIQSYRSHWNHIDSLIESFPADNDVELQILKTVGLLNLLDRSHLLATDETIVLAIAGKAEGETAARVHRTIKKLQREKHVLYNRGASGGYCLWPHTSVNLERAYEDAVQSLGPTPPDRVSPLLHSYFETRPLVARRHYIETGNLRHFEVEFCSVDQLNDSLSFDYKDADGRIVVVLCETAEEHQEALRFVGSSASGDMPNVLIGITKPLGVLGKLVQELQRWEWIEGNTPELNNDKFARDEVSRQLTNARHVLVKRIQSLVGLQQLTGRSDLRWFNQTSELNLNTTRELLEQVSSICDDVYKLAPRVFNELINRRAPSSAAVGARTRLLEGMFESSEVAYLGMNPLKKPPEMAIYLSILARGGVHREVEGGFEICEPPIEDPCNILPSLHLIKRILESKGGSRLRVSDVMSELRRPPYGVRDGLSPILITLFCLIHEQNIAFFDNGIFMRQMAGLDIMRMTKTPTLFEIQYCEVAGVRSDLFRRLLAVLDEQAPEVSRRHRKQDVRKNIDLLDVVRPLCKFAAELPPHVLKTSLLTPTAMAVRSALVNAREPATLLFQALPTACGFPPISAGSRPEVVEGLVKTLRNAIEELRHTFVRLRERIRVALEESFGVSGELETLRPILAVRAQAIALDVSDTRLKAFCMRLADSELDDAAWIESLGSFVCSSPPNKWTDSDGEKFAQELGILVAKFKRVESIAFNSHRHAKSQSAMRVAITYLDGSEIDEVIFISSADKKKMARVEAQITAVLENANQQIGLAGAAQAFWKALQKDLPK